jgi:hypothetical protein
MECRDPGTKRTGEPHAQQEKDGMCVQEVHKRIARRERDFV